MLYIHKLADLNRKSADIESVYLIREMKHMSRNLPAREFIVNHLSEYLVSETDLSMMQSALDLITPTVEMVQVLIDRQDPNLYEPINLQRVIQMLNQLREPLTNSLNFGKDIFSEQVNLITEAADGLAMFHDMKTADDRVSANAKIGRIFDKILRNSKDFYFFYEDIIHEGHVGSLDGLCKAIPKGFFFHITLEEEIKKLEFSLVKVRIPEEKLKEADAIQLNLEAIKKAVERAYDINIRMVSCSVTLYTYLKWAMGG